MAKIFPARSKNRAVLDGYGTAVASAATIILPRNGRTHSITGTTAIEHISKIGYKQGATKRLVFAGACTLTHNAGSVPTGYAAVKLSGAVNHVSAAGDSVDLEFDGTDWRERGRARISGFAGSITAQVLSGAGAISLLTPTTLFTSTGAAEALTLADGTQIGFRKRIIHAVDGGSGVITAGGALHLGHSIATITFTDVRDWVELEWDGTNWNVIGYAGATFA